MLALRKYISDSRTKIIAKNIFWSGISKGIGIAITFLFVPILLGYLDASNYGIWLTISAFLGWFGVFDFGVGNGLRNKLVEAIALNDFKLARTYVSTSYAALGLIFSVVLIVFLVISTQIKWSSVFNAPPEMEGQLFWSVIFLFASMSIQFVLKLISTILLAFHKVAWSDFYFTLIQLVLLLVIYNFKELGLGQSILQISIAYAVVPLIIFMILNVYYFKTKFAFIKPSFGMINWQVFKDLRSLGLFFFLIQLSAIIVFATDNMLITHLFSPEEVTIYNIAYKYFSIVTVGFSFVIAPFWSMATDSISKQDFTWIRNSIKILMVVWLGVLAFSGLLLLFAGKAYELWTNNMVSVDFRISFTCFVYVSLMAWNNIFAFILNGIGKIKLQLYISILLMIVNIPLCLLFVKGFGFGVEGIPLVGVCCMLIWALIGPIQLNKLMGGKAKGLWAK